VSVFSDHLESALWSFGRFELTAVLPKGGTVPFTRNVVRRLTDILSDVAAAGVGLDGQSAVSELEDRILQTIAEGLCEKGQTRAACGRHGDRVAYVRRARDYIDAHLGDSLLLSRVAASAGVSSRTMELAFRDVLGVGPIKYIRTRRLNRARRLLLKASGGDRPVSEVAVDCGLFHLGHFSRDYKALFGELPSETLGRGKHAYK
jgi:AraC family ethanolamine operon transcriptional activator